VDVRLIAATNRDLVHAVEEKEFRGDLFYRLHVFPLHLPALRDRREDIPMLVRHFVEKCSFRLHKRIDVIPDEAIDAMMKWRWPGNIRELENFIERSVILSEGNRLNPPLGELREEVSAGFRFRRDAARQRTRAHHRNSAADSRRPVRSGGRGGPAGTQAHHPAVQDAAPGNLAHGLFALGGCRRTAKSSQQPRPQKCRWFSGAKRGLAADVFTCELEGNLIGFTACPLGDACVQLGSRSS
jgi:transcriptional regulator with AAA-type ATPase domain